MKIISLFNNKGGVGKTTLAFHLSWALQALGKRVLMIDLDPQCNLTIFGIDEEILHEIWEVEDCFIEDYGHAQKTIGENKYKEINRSNRSIHYLLKTTEEGISDVEELSKPIELSENIGLIPGRLTLHYFENKIAERWTGAYQGDPLSIRTLTRIRALAEDYAEKYKYDFVILDTSPSLGVLNKIIISTVDGFIIPCLPDMFSLYGVRNIGNALRMWKKEFDTMYSLIQNRKRERFPKNFVQFVGYTIYNARKYAGATEWDLAKAHYHYAKLIPDVIVDNIDNTSWITSKKDTIKEPIGGTAIMHSHSTLPNMSQKYKKPMWMIPGLDCLENEDRGTIAGNRASYLGTEEKYISFAKSLLSRLEV